MTRVAAGIGYLAALLLAVGGASKAGVCHADEDAGAPQWPPAPQVARISYLYSVTSPADLKIGRGALGRFWRFIKGGAPERISKPQGIHVDAAGRLYVVDTGQRRVHVFDTASSRYFSFPGKPVSGFEYPVAVAADGKGRVYVSDSSTGLVHVFDLFGRKYLRSVGKGELRRPTGLALRPESDELLVVDTLASEIAVFDTRDFSLKKRADGAGGQRDAMHYPTHVAVSPDGEVYVTDALNFGIRILNSDLCLKDYFGEAGDGPGSFSRPKGVAVDSERNIYVVDALFDNVQIFNRDGDLLLTFGVAGHAAGEFWLPSDIFIGSDDRIYVADSYNARVQVFQYSGRTTE